MAKQRKLGRPTDQRSAMLKNQVSNLLWYGEIETTLDKAKSVQRIAEKLITVAIKTYADEVTVVKSKQNEKGVLEQEKVINDGPKKLAARRKLMANLYDIQYNIDPDVSKKDYKKDGQHPLIEKMFRVYAPKYAQRAQEKGVGGGYTRVLKLGVRKGDSAEMAVIKLVD